MTSTTGLLRTAQATLGRLRLLSDGELMFIGELEKAVEQIKAEKEEEEPPADAPEEFLDALLYTVMKDPVQLPRCVGRFGGLRVCVCGFVGWSCITH